MSETKGLNTYKTRELQIAADILKTKQSMNFDTLCADPAKKFSTMDGYREEFGFGNNTGLVATRYIWFTAKLCYLYIAKRINSLRIKK